MSTVVTSTHVDRLRAADLPALRTFLRARPDATVFHSPEWLDTIGAAYGHRCDYWLARSDGVLTGVFPVLIVRAPLLGAKMVAMAYQMESGQPLAESAETASALIRRAAQEAAATPVRYLEVRSLAPAPELVAAGFNEVDSGLVTTVVDLAGMGPGRLRRNHRRSVRSAEERGVTIVESRSSADLQRFQRLYLREGRAIGAPQAGWRFFECLHRHAAERYRLYLARLNGRTIGGMVTVGDPRCVFARHAAYSSPEALGVHAGAALYWRAIQDAAASGVERFNCGISWGQDAGLIHWKEGWAGATTPVRLYVLPIRGDAPSPGEYLGGFRLAKSIWRRLPLPLADLGGQLVTRWVC